MPPWMPRWDHDCELCGVTERLMRNIFVHGTAELSEVNQIRISRLLS